MKAKVSSWLNVLLTAILGIIGYNCSGSRGNVLCAYGVPSADFTLEGTVSNEDDEPLQNIQILHYGGWRDGTGTMYWGRESDTIYTNADGNFYRYYPRDFPMTYYKVIANDTAGIYAPDTIVTTETFTGGDGNWYRGKADLKADFVLKKK